MMENHWPSSPRPANMWPNSWTSVSHACTPSVPSVGSSQLGNELLRPTSASMIATGSVNQPLAQPQVLLKRKKVFP
jgi:hypothetical protein